MKKTISSLSCALLLCSLASAWFACSSPDDAAEPSGLQGGAKLGEPAEALSTASAAIGASSRAQCAQGTESLRDYTARCKEAMDGVDIPGFACNSGLSTEVMNQGYTYGDGVMCNAPDVLNQECDRKSRFQVIRRGVNPTTGATDGIYIVAHCRKKQNTAWDKYADIAMIAYNKNTGDTCFFQALQNPQVDSNAPLPQIVVAPGIANQTDKSDPNYYPWQSPALTASQNCVGCHDNGPFLRSPYLGQLAGKGPEGVWLGGPGTPAAPDRNYLPGTTVDENTWNQSMPYRFVGLDFQSWKTYQLTTNYSCTSCHRMAISTNNGTYFEGGTGRDYGVRSTAAQQVAKNPHGPDSPIWMRPGKYKDGTIDQTRNLYDQAIHDDSRRVKTCAEWLIDRSKPGPTSGEICRSQLLGEGAMCSSIPVVPAPTQSINTTGSVNETTPIGPAFDCDVRGCQTVFPYYTMVRGPFYQETPSSIDIQSPGFRGSFVRIFAANSQWQKQKRLETGPLLGADSPGEPDVKVEFLPFSRVSSIINWKSCSYSRQPLQDTNGQSPTSTVGLGPKENLSILGSLIGNVSRGREPENSTKVSSGILGNSLVQNHSLDVGPRWFQSDAYTYTCPNWNAYSALAVNNAKASTQSNPDISLVSFTMASKVVCYISGLSGEWSVTRPDSTHPGASTQPYAEIYVGPGGDIRLKTYAPSAYDIGASASCLYVNPP